jgi:NAD(P)-dependent dehydrogenase (short-subunit alcohol dehydrogenase family)
MMPDAVRTFATYPELEGRVVFNTGGGGGIGFELARAFASNGCRIVLVDVNKDSLITAVATLRMEYPHVAVESFCASVTDEVELAKAVAFTIATFGQIDIVLSNAGVSSNAPSLDISLDSWRRTVDINLTGTFLTAQLTARELIKRHSGVIISMSSMWGVSTSPERTAYCASKAGVSAMTACLAAEWAPHGIRVNAIGPGYVKTQLTDDLVSEGRIDGAEIERATPLGRFGLPEEIANMGLFIASDYAAFMTGQTVILDGGWTSNGYLSVSSGRTARS